MESEKTFRTKTGFCHIQPDQIILTRDGIVGNVSEVMVGNNITKTLVTYGALSLVFIYSAFETFKNGKTLQPIFFGLIGLYLIIGIVRSLNNSSTPIIHRKKIKEVTFKKGLQGLTRSRFEVLFQDENGKMKKRLIMLPGSLNDGQDETEKAVEIMREEQLLK